jgi:hypothetical protein
MALYTPRSQRRRNTLLLSLATLVLGAALGVLGGRLTAPTVDDRVVAVQGQARQITSQLRVLSLHSEAGASSLGASGDAGADRALQRVGTDLTNAFDQAPWIPAAERDKLRGGVQDLERRAPTEASHPEFGKAAGQLADDVDKTFGLTG